MSARAEGAARALFWGQPTTAAAAVPTPANKGPANAEGVEIPAPQAAAYLPAPALRHVWQRGAGTHEGPVIQGNRCGDVLVLIQELTQKRLSWSCAWM